MKDALHIVIVAVVFGLVGWFAGCDHGRGMNAQEPPKVVTVTPSPIAPETLRISSTRVVYRDTGHVDSVPYAVIVRRVDSVLIAAGVKNVTACADTAIKGDTISVCCTYPDPRFTFGVRFAPRTVAVPQQSAPWLSWHPIAAVDVSLDQQVFAGAGFELGVGPLRVDGLAGFQRIPFAATAHVTGRWVFD